MLIFKMSMKFPVQLNFAVIVDAFRSIAAMDVASFDAAAVCVAILFVSNTFTLETAKTYNKFDFHINKLSGCLTSANV